MHFTLMENFVRLQHRLQPMIALPPRRAEVVAAQLVGAI
jgi:hypothetical protein